jgi:hypothetical protein
MVPVQDWETWRGKDAAIVKPLVKIFVETKPSLPLSGFARCNDPEFDFVVSEDTTYSSCDVAILYGCAKDVELTPKTAIKGSIHRSHTGPKLIVETGFTGRVNTPRRRFLRLRTMLGRAGVAFSAAHAYYRVGLDGAFGDDADFANEGSPPDRWTTQCEAGGISVRPYRRTGRHILLVGQVPGDASLRGLSLTQWAVETARQIRERTDRPIWFRAHPNMDIQYTSQIRRGLAAISKTKMLPLGRSFSRDLENCWVCVTYSSSSSVDALIAGIPAICLSPANIAYGICSKSVDEVESPAEPDRDQWFYDLAYAQWSSEEIGLGLVWPRFRHKVLARLAHRSIA